MKRRKHKVLVEVTFDGLLSDKGAIQMVDSLISCGQNHRSEPPTTLMPHMVKVACKSFPRVMAAEVLKEKATKAELERALEGMLNLEKTKARSYGLEDCCCATWSRETERAYERGQCVHQIARQALQLNKG